MQWVSTKISAIDILVMSTVCLLQARARNCPLRRLTPVNQLMVFATRRLYCNCCRLA